MKVVLLAAGRSKRMFPISDKNLIKICGKPLIWHQVERMKAAGLMDFLVVCNAFNEKSIQEILGSIKGILIETVKQINLNDGMAGAILAAEEKIGDQEILVVSSNDLVEKRAFELMIEASSNNKYEVFVLGKKVSSYFPGGYLEVDESMHLKSIAEKPKPGEEPSDLINLVVHFFRNPIRLFQFVASAKSKRDDRYEMALSNMIGSGVKTKVISYDDSWFPVKYPWHIFPLSNHIFSQMPKTISKQSQISNKAVIKGEVIIEDGVRIFEGAVINGPCYIGKNTIVANNALVREAFLGDCCTVGFGSEIARSFVGENCWFHTNYIGDSFIGDNCSFGSGARTANLRLDEEEITVIVNGEKIGTGTTKMGAIVGANVRIGVNTSIMPGIKIGARSMIGSGIVIAEDIAENQFVRAKWLLKVDDNRVSVDPMKRIKMRSRLEGKN